MAAPTTSARRFLPFQSFERSKGFQGSGRPGFACDVPPFDVPGALCPGVVPL